MYTLKSFMSYGAMADNTIGQIAPLGELSTDSLTYAKEVGQYEYAEFTDPTLITFKSAREDGSLTVPADYAYRALAIGQWAITRASAGDFTTDGGVFSRLLLSEFDTYVRNLEMGVMIYNGTLWLPEWIAYEQIGDEENRVKIWFSDESFRSQYDDYEIEIIPPVDVIDNLFKRRVDVIDLVESRDLGSLFQLIEEKRQRYPFTRLRTDAFDWKDRQDATYSLPTNWTIILYGRAADNLDVIKQELVDWILANSAYTRDDWVLIYPDLFTNTEFIITPMWTQYALENRQLQSGVYSPTVSVDRALTIGEATAKGQGYTTAWVRSHLRVSAVPYKSLAFLAIGSPENRDGIVDFNQRFVDYIAVGTASTDFARMSLTTQKWVLFFNELLKIAESMTATSDVPIGYSRIERDGIYYAAGSYERVQYLVVVRSVLETIDPPHLG